MSGNGNGNGKNGSTDRSILVIIAIIGVTGIIAATISSAGSILILGFCGVTCAQLFTTYQQRRAAAATAAEQKKEAAAKIAEVKVALEDTATVAVEKIDGLAKVAKETHALVNGHHGVALATVYEQAVRIARLTGDPLDAAKADDAKVKLAEHEEGERLPPDGASAGPRP